MKFICTWLLLIVATHLFSQQARNQPRVYVNVGEDRVIRLPTTKVELEAKLDAPRNVTYSWQQLQGSREAIIGTPDELKTTISNLKNAETYQFVFSVFYKEKIVGSDSISITVQNRNSPPEAKAGPDVTITLPRNSLSIEGRVTDKDENLSIVGWAKLSGPEVTVNQDGPLLLLSELKEGSYQFELLAIDDLKSEDRDVVNVIVNPENKRPRVNAGRDVTITLPINSTVLNGSATDDNNAALTYRWSQLPGATRARIDTPTNQITKVEVSTPGSYTFVLVATDRQEASGSDTVIVTVKRGFPPPRDPPVADAGRDQIIQLPVNQVTLSGRGRGEDGVALSFFWTKTDGPDQFEISDPTNAQTTVTGLTEGEYFFELLVVDSFNSPDRDVMKVTVNPAEPDTILDTINLPPIAKAGPDITITTAGGFVTLQAEMSDPEQKPITFTWKQLAGPQDAIVDSSSQFNAAQSNLPEGEYVFELTVTDDQGLTSADSVSIILAFPPPPPPWPLILAIAVGSVGLIAASKYFIGWIPLPKKVLVYYLDEAEESIVDSILPNAEKTESFSVGNSKSSDIKKLKEKNIAVHVLNTNHLVVNTPGRIQTYNYSKKKGFKRNVTKHFDDKSGNVLVNLVGEGQQKMDTAIAEYPAFLLITLDGPLLPAYESRLKEKGIEIIQHVPVCSYIIRLSDAQQLRALDEPLFNFIRVKQPYSSQDTGIIVREQHFRDAVQSNHALLLDLLLHRETDMASVIQFLEGLPVRIVDKYRNRIRIKADANVIIDLKLADHTAIQAIYEYIPPVWTNDVARHLVGIDQEIAGQSTIALTGDGEIIGVADTGIDQQHADLQHRIIAAASWGRKATNDTSDPHGHGTHVAASIAGDGTASGGKIKGIAPGAKLYFQSLIEDDGSLGGFGLRLEELFQEAYDKGVRVHNNSWGSAAEARYTIDTTIVDEFIHEHPEMLIVFSAGNEGCYNSFNDKEKGYVGFGTVGSPATTKNGLAVGASRNKRISGGYATKTYGAIWKERFPFPPTSTELISGDPEGIAAYSSRGRCDDYRMKPDIVAPGTDILSARSHNAPLHHFHGGFAEYNDAYAFLGGTSMASPMVAGAAALVREFYKKQRNCPNPSAALVKATLINGTRKLTGASAIHGGDQIPNPNQGFGMLDLLHTIPNSQHQFMLNFHDSLSDPNAILRTTGQGFKSKVRLAAASWIRVCIAYTDFPVRAIQSDLDLIIEHKTSKQKWSGNRGINGQDPYESKVEDRTNNLEIIRINEAQPGLYTINVIAHNLPKGDQGFALVITTGDMGAKFA